MSAPVKCRRVYPETEAMQWDGENASEVVEWAQGGWKDNGIWLRQRWEENALRWALILPDDGFSVLPGDWIVKRQDGSLIGMTAYAFAGSYELVME